MAFFTVLALVGGAGIAGAVAVRKSKSPRVIDVVIDGVSKQATVLLDLLADSSQQGMVIDGVPKQATVLPPKPQQAIIRARKLVQDLFGDRRQQQQRALNSGYVDEAQQALIAQQKQKIVMAATGLGLATIGALVAPIFYLPSLLCTIYTMRTRFQSVYRIVVKERSFDYQVLMAASVVTAIAWGFIWQAAFGVLFAAVNGYLVAKTEQRSKRSIADLFGGQIRTVWLLIDGVEIETPFEDVQVGDTVVVHAGQMIPVDGRITEDTAAIDQHMLTGESQPVEKGVDDGVLASTIVLSGRLCIAVEKAGDATVAGQITEMLSQTNDFKQVLESRTDRWLNRIALPIVGLSALALPIAGSAGAVAMLWYYPGFRMLLFGPISMLSYLQVAARRGILIKDGRALEVMHEIDTVVFDKTGTLTLEQPMVSGIRGYNGVAELEILRYAATAEAKQSHPIARAILQAAREQGLDLLALEDAEYKVGYGLKTQIAGRATHIGSVRFMVAEGICVPAEVATQQAESHAQGHSLVLVALDGQIVGGIELQPTIRPEVREIIQALHNRGVATVIISGDDEAPTRRLATDLGIDRYFAQVLPEDKANLVTQLQSEGHKVCFVGDGINDSIALKAANVAVSLRGATTIATDMAEIVFMNGTLRQLAELFTLADEFAANMRVNLVASMLPGIVGIAGTLLFGWGMTTCILLLQTSTPVGIYNAVKPLLDERNERNAQI